MCVVAVAWEEGSALVSGVSCAARKRNLYLIAIRDLQNAVVGGSASVLAQRKMRVMSERVSAVNCHIGYRSNGVFLADFVVQLTRHVASDATSSYWHAAMQAFTLAIYVCSDSSRTFGHILTVAALLDAHQGTACCQRVVSSLTVSLNKLCFLDVDIVVCTSDSSRGCVLSWMLIY